MKGLSILLTLALLVLAHQLARQLKKTGALPVEHRASAGLTNPEPWTAYSQGLSTGATRTL